MHLLLFDSEDAATASRIVSFDPAANRTGHYWHMHLPGIAAGQVYAYRADGPYAPGYGYRFDPEKVAHFGDAEIAQLLADPGIIRSRAKIEAAIWKAMSEESTSW